MFGTGIPDDSETFPLNGRVIADFMLVRDQLIPFEFRVFMLINVRGESPPPSFLM